MPTELEPSSLKKLQKLRENKVENLNLLFFLLIASAATLHAIIGTYLMFLHKRFVKQMKDRGSN